MTISSSPEQAANIPIVIKKGRDFQKVYYFQDDDGVAIPLTGYTVKAEIRDGKKSTDTLIATFTTDNLTDLDSGEVWLELTDTVTDAITDKGGFYDLVLIDASGIGFTYAEGRVDFTDGPTDMV